MLQGSKAEAIDAFLAELMAPVPIVELFLRITLVAPHLSLRTEARRSPLGLSFLSPFAPTAGVPEDTSLCRSACALLICTATKGVDSATFRSSAGPVGLLFNPATGFNCANSVPGAARRAAFFVSAKWMDADVVV